MSNSELRSLNKRIGLALGFTPFGESRYKWLNSEQIWRPYRVDGYDYKPFSSSGLLVALPKYKLRKVNAALVNQWVICQWEAPIPEEQWRKQFGYSMEWPSHGDYYPTGVVLDRGVEPTVTLTEVFIREMNHQLKKKYADHLKEAEDAVAAGERKDDNRVEDVVVDALPAFLNDPGKKGHVSFPGVQSQQ